MATNVTAYGVVYGAADNTTAMQTALNANVPLAITGEVTCLGDLTADRPSLHLTGNGSLLLPSNKKLYIQRIAGMSEIGLRANVKIDVGADVRNAIFDGINPIDYDVLTGAGEWYFNGGQTTGLKFQNIETYRGPGAFIYGRMDGVTIENCIFRDRVPEGIWSAAGEMLGINGSNNIIRNSEIHLNRRSNALKFFTWGQRLPGVNNANAWKVGPSNRNNKVYGNKITSQYNSEERLVFDGEMGDNCITNAYVSAIAGRNITLTGVDRNSYYNVTLAQMSLQGHHLVVNNGPRAGNYFEIEAHNATPVITLYEAPFSQLAVGDFVSILRAFVNNEFYDNDLSEIAEPIDVNGYEEPESSCSAIVLAHGALGNYVHDNIIGINGGMFWLPGLEELPIVGLHDDALIIIYDHVNPNYILYTMNAYNRWEDNEIRGGQELVNSRVTINYMASPENDYFDFQYLPNGAETMSSIGITFKNNRCVGFDSNAFVHFSNQTNLVNHNNLFPGDIYRHNIINEDFIQYTPPPPPPPPLSLKHKKGSQWEELTLKKKDGQTDTATLKQKKDGVWE
jgi:hypothetical protein